MKGTNRQPPRERRVARRVRFAHGVIGLLLVAVATIAAAVPSAAQSSGDDAGRRYQPPIDAPVVDPFRPPPEPWLAGNRGLEYETIAGSRVGAIGAGQVIFAGPVAGDLHVTIRHPDGLRSSYSFLAAIHVRVGQRLATGATVGVTGEMFHLGVRDHNTYIDPAGLWGRWVSGGLVMLVPLDARDGGRRTLERFEPSEPGALPGWPERSRRAVPTRDDPAGPGGGSASGPPAGPAGGSALENYARAAAVGLDLTPPSWVDP